MRERKCEHIKSCMVFSSSFLPNGTHKADKTTAILICTPLVSEHYSFFLFLSITNGEFFLHSCVLGFYFLKVTVLANERST